MNKRKATVLAFGLLVIAVLLVFSTAMFLRIVHSQKSLQKNIDITQAFWLAEAAFDRAALDWRQNGTAQNITVTPMGQGEYKFEYTTVYYDNSNTTQRHTYVAYGYVPNATAPRVTRSIEFSVPMFPPGNFSLITDNNITVSGTSNTIRGDVLYGGNLTGELNIDTPGEVAIQDPEFDFELLNFTYLKSLSQSQGNYYDATSPFDPKTDSPASFWYNNVTNGMPNVIYLDNQTLDLAGSETIHGFFIVGGDATYDASLVGNSFVDGCIYTQGDFIDKGGGSNLDVQGTVWAGGNSTLTGSVNLNFNNTYYQAMKILIGRGMRITWRDRENPYSL